MVDLFTLFPDLPWPRHSWRTFAEQIGERRRAIERMRQEARGTIARQHLAAARAGEAARARRIGERSVR